MRIDTLDLYEKPCLVVAHPDDEAISSSQFMYHLGSKIHLVYATGNEVRQTEAKKAASLIDSLDIARMHFFGIEESIIYEKVAMLHAKLRDVLDYVSPDIVITHAFEGSHFDHDLVRFIVEKIRRELRNQFILAQFALYFCKDGIYHHNVFVDPRQEDVVLVPKEDDIERKREMFAAYRSQHCYLQFFDPTNIERIRICGRDEEDPRRFLSRPHEGKIGYDCGINTLKTWELFQRIVLANL